jgi:hypothetical protein
MPPSLSLCRKKNILRRNTALFFERDQFFDLYLGSADARTIFISPDVGGNFCRGRTGQDVVPGAHHVTAVDGHGAHGGVGEDVAHRNREFQLLGDRHEILAVRTEAVQPDDAVFWLVSRFQGDIGKNRRHFLVLIRIMGGMALN